MPKAPTVWQEDLELDVRDVLELLTLADGYAAEVGRGRAIAAGRTVARQPATSVDGRLARSLEVRGLHGARRRCFEQRVEVRLDVNQPGELRLRRGSDRRSGALKRLERLRELFEMGDLPRAAYVRRRDALQDELAQLSAAPPPS